MIIAAMAVETKKQCQSQAYAVQEVKTVKTRGLCGLGEYQKCLLLSKAPFYYCQCIENVPCSKGTR